MNIKEQVKNYNINYETIKSDLGHDASKKVGAILDILEIGSPNIAHSKLVLHICEDLLEKCSLSFGTKTDA